MYVLSTSVFQIQVIYLLFLLLVNASYDKLYVFALISFDFFVNSISNTFFTIVSILI